MSDHRIVLRGGSVVDTGHSSPLLADLAMRNGVIVAVGAIGNEPGDADIDVTGRFLMPGFIDTHSHADGAVFRDDVQRALLKQGVTTVILGQDGVSYAPGNGRYATEYFSAINGAHPFYGGGGVGQLLAGYDSAVPVNVAYLVPVGTVRHEVMGYEAGRASVTQTVAMRNLIEQGLDEGALGISTGLDYVPGIHQDTTELIEISKSVAAADRIYVTHMRGGYEQNACLGTDEIAAIAIATGVRVHISHFHGPASLLLRLADDLINSGINLSYDAYPYRRGCTLLAMPILPASLLSRPPSEAAAILRDPTQRMHLHKDWFSSLEAGSLMGPEWADNLVLAHVASDAYSWSEGMSLRAAAVQSKTDPASFALDILAASNLAASAVIKVHDQRSYNDLAKLLKHPVHTAGSDGIYIGKMTHPRAWGAFAKFLSVFTRERGDYSWSDAAQHLSSGAAERFGLNDRGRILPGYAADVVIVDPHNVADRASYDAPRNEAVGIDDVFVNGLHVLREGKLTGENAGRSLRPNKRTESKSTK